MRWKQIHRMSKLDPAGFWGSLKKIKKGSNFALREQVAPPASSGGTNYRINFATICI